MNEQENTESTETPELKMSADEIRTYLRDLNREVKRIELIQRNAQWRVQRYNDLTTRVGFLRKGPEKVRRGLRRLSDARHRVEQCLTAFNTLDAQIVQYQSMLVAM